MDYTTIRIRTEDYHRLKELADKDERTIVWFMSKLLNVLDPKDKPERKNPSLDKKKGTHPLFKEMKDIYINKWVENNRFRYTWNGVIDASALNRLIKTLENLNESNQPVTVLFQLVMDKLPEFYKDKTINAINKNINGIIADIKSSNFSIREYYGF